MDAAQVVAASVAMIATRSKAPTEDNAEKQRESRHPASPHAEGIAASLSLALLALLALLLSAPRVLTLRCLLEQPALLLFERFSQLAWRVGLEEAELLLRRTVLRLVLLARLQCQA